VLDEWGRMILVVADDRKRSLGQLAALFEGIVGYSSVFGRHFRLHCLPPDVVPLHRSQAL
jgi:hypothetical protein